MGWYKQGYEVDVYIPSFTCLHYLRGRLGKLAPQHCGRILHASARSRGGVAGGSECRHGGGNLKKNIKVTVLDGIVAIWFTVQLGFCRGGY